MKFLNAQRRAGVYAAFIYTLFCLAGMALYLILLGLFSAVPAGAQQPPAEQAAQERCFNLSELIHPIEGGSYERFWVSVDFWRDGDPVTHACPVNHEPGTYTAHQRGDTRIFYFFSPDNLEVMVKVLDGCAINGHYWVFAAGLTDLNWRLNVKREAIFQPLRTWIIGPPEKVMKHKIYRDTPGNPRSPDLFIDRSTGSLFHMLDDRNPPPRVGDATGYSLSDKVPYVSSTQVAEVKAFRCS